MKLKCLLAIFILSTISFTALADAVLFFDGTVKYAKPGVIQSAFPTVPLYKCGSLKTCWKVINSYPRVGIVFNDLQRMKEAVNPYRKAITIQHIHRMNYGSFVLNVYDVVVTMSGVKMALVQVIIKNKHATNVSVAQGIVNEFVQADQRSNVQ